MEGCSISENYIPKIENSDEDIRELSYKKAHEVYGENLPKIVQERLEIELTAIIENGFSSIYMLAQKIAKYAKESGHLVGVEYSIGNSFVATMLEITDINPLKVHCLCQKCKHVDFTSEILELYSNIKDLNCPICGEVLTKDGYDLPFELFMGIDLDKQPLFSLNVGYEFKEKVFDYISELFKENNVLRLCERHKNVCNELFCTVCNYGNSKTNCSTNTGYENRCNSSAALILPVNKTINDYSPIYNLENDKRIYLHDKDVYSGIFHQRISGNYLLSILEELERNTSFDSSKIDLDDEAIINLLCETNFLEDVVAKGSTNNLACSIIRKTQPESFGDLVKVYGLLQDDGTWTDNAEYLIDSEIATIDELVSSRDEIMTYLISKGIDRVVAFKIMEDVRKGKGTSKQEDTLKIHNIPQWYIESLNKIKYLLPKSNIIDDVKEIVRIGYFKIYYPEVFYQTVFTMQDRGKYDKC